MHLLVRFVHVCLHACKSLEAEHTNSVVIHTSTAPAYSQSGNNKSLEIEIEHLKAQLRLQKGAGASADP